MEISEEIDSTIITIEGLEITTTIMETTIVLELITEILEIEIELNYLKALNRESEKTKLAWPI